MRREPDPIRRAIRYGLDVTLLTSHLRLPPEKRLIRALDDASAVQLIRPQGIHTDLWGMIEAFTENDSRFVLAGGLAASVHGSAYVTWDLDLCYDSRADNAERLLWVLEQWKPTARDDGDAEDWRLDAARLASAPITRLRTTEGDVDLFREMPGVGDYLRCRAKSEPVIVHGIEVWVLGLDALISAKRSSPLPPFPCLGPLLSLKSLRALKERERIRAASEGPALA